MRLCREQEGAVDIVSYIRPLDTLKIAESPFAKVVKSKDVTILGGVFNQRKRDSKWRDVRLRKAVNYAINRKELWKYAAKGNAYNLGGWIPPGAYGYNSDLTLRTNDTAQAKALLAEAGYPNGFEMKIVTTEAFKLEAQVISKMLARIGLKVSFDVLTWPEFLKKKFIPLLDKPPEEQQWDMSLGEGYDWCGHIGVSFSSWVFIEDSDWRWIEYDSVYEKMWKDIVGTVESSSQEEKFRQMQKYAWDRFYALTVYSPLSLYAVNKEVDFVPFESRRLALDFTSVTEDHWSIRGMNK
jgi:ABC-type transport system substrate-binding protein